MANAAAAAILGSESKTSSEVGEVYDSHEVEYEC
jgi:hypothetical protein